MKKLPIVRRKEDGSEGSDAEQFELHLFPYQTLPIIKSHVLPQYVIYNAGEKLSTMKQVPEVYDKFLETNAHIQQLPDRAFNTLYLYLQWTKGSELPQDWLENGPPPTRSPPTHSSPTCKGSSAAIYGISTW
jgi:hypothetical protein